VQKSQCPGGQRKPVRSDGRSRPEPGETAWEVGVRRAEREEGSFSYRNATVIEHQGQAAGCLIGYEIPDLPDPIGSDIPPMFVPLQELENLAPATWYVNVLAVLPQYRNQGLGTELLSLAEKTGRTLDKCGMSVIVSDANESARRLYEQCGYRAAATRPIVKEGWSTKVRTGFCSLNLFFEQRGPERQIVPSAAWRRCCLPCTAATAA
jgi:ribosomal protein S18 acetylase RimI-like enzyme